MNRPSQRLLYLASEECDRPELPVAFEVTRLLSVEHMLNKAAVKRTIHPVYQQQLSEFVVLAKGHESITSAYDGILVGVFLLPLDQRAGLDALDLSRGLQPVQDWCAISASSETASRWQLRS